MMCEASTPSFKRPRQPAPGDTSPTPNSSPSGESPDPDQPSA